MHKTFNYFFITSLALSSTTAVTNASYYHKNITNTSNKNHLLTNLNAKTYATETAIVPKALLISKNKLVNTNNLITNMYNNFASTHINNLTPHNNTFDDFITNWTTNLDTSTTATLSTLFETNGANESNIEQLYNKIETYEQGRNYLASAQKILTNKNLSNENTIEEITAFINTAKTIPNINNFLSYLQNLPLTFDLITTLLTDWDKPQSSSLIDAMMQYMSSKGTISQAWNNKKGHWYYLKKRAANWNWNQFYQYIAGVNFNYMFKLITDKYIGDMISDAIHTGWFDEKKFLENFDKTLDIVINNPQSWPYLMKSLIPIIKMDILHLQDPTLAITSIDWNDDNDNQIHIKLLLEKLQYLLSPKGHNDLIALLETLLHNSFGEDITVHIPILGYYTLPQLFSTFSWFINSKKMAIPLADKVITISNKLNLLNIINTSLEFTNKFLTTNPIINLEDLLHYVNVTFNSKDFNTALLQLKDMIENPLSPFHIKDVLKLLGVNFQGDNFITNSVLDNLSLWLKTPNSSINQLLTVLIGDEKNSGIFDNLINEQKKLYQEQYSQFFDLNNDTYFTLTSINMNLIKNGDTTYTALLEYNIINKLNNKTYNIKFKNNDFYNSKDFKLTLMQSL